MKNTARVVGWVCFGIAAVIYLFATCYFGFSFEGAIADYKAGETAGLGILFFAFAVFGSITYFVAAAVSAVGLLVANVKRGERKFFFAPIIPLALTVLTWVIFVSVGLSF